MEPINIIKKINCENHSMEIKYFGIINNNENQNEINRLLNDFINNHKHNYMVENVRIIRTILRDCDEKFLSISYQDESESKIIKFDNSNLFLYEKCKSENKDEYFDGYNFKYEPLYGIKLDYNNHKINSMNSTGIELFSKEMNDIMQEIHCLKNIKPIALDNDDKLLINIYKLFYNENPDFSSKDIDIKIQTMMSILEKFGISLENNYGFSICGKTKMPISLKLEQQIDKLYPIGKVNQIDEDIEIVSQYKKIIKVIGECVEKTITSSKNKNEALITISKVIHAGGFCLSSDSDIKKLSEFTDRTVDDVETSIKLVKSIKNRIGV